MGSIADPTYVQQIHQLEDRLKIARTSFDERESSLEAAIRSEEEKHQREIERFRKKMEEFDKQRAAIARQQNGESAVLSEPNGSSTALDESLQLLAQGESSAIPNVQNPSAMLVEFDNDVGLPVDGSDEEPSPPSSASVPAVSASSTSEASTPPASVPVDELIPESYLKSAASSAAGTDTTSKEPTPTAASQPRPGQS
eukprot:jgi/Phyca11/510218/fgenesh2_kg.PHYCAscaffold_55_\